MGLTASLTGAALFAIAPAVGWVFAGRALMGLGVGLAMGPASAAVIEFSAKGATKRAGAITTTATAVGLAWPPTQVDCSSTSVPTPHCNNAGTRDNTARRSCMRNSRPRATSATTSA